MTSGWGGLFTTDTNFTPSKRRAVKKCLDCGDGILAKGGKKVCSSCSSIRQKIRKSHK